MWGLITAWLIAASCLDQSTAQTTVPPTPVTMTTVVLPGTSEPVNITEVCFADVGCFQNVFPFNNTHGKLPLDPANLNVTLGLWTRANNATEDYDELFYNDDGSSVKNSHFSAQRPTKVIIHGFSGSFNKSDWVHDLREVLLRRGDFNIIGVDWGDAVKFPDYDQAVANVRVVATVVKLLLDKLQAEGLSYDDLHLIGHSLGAQMSGYIGKTVGADTVARISGLDPAEPDFESFPTVVKLDKTDGKFVDVIHTNGQKFDGLSGFGTMEPCGHVDFYVNGGEVQRGCDDGLKGVSSGLLGALSSDDLIDEVGDAASCSHGRAHDVFIESLNSTCQFTAYPCDSYEMFEQGQCLSCNGTGCNVAGYDADQYPGRGLLYLDTASSKPLCGFYHHVTVLPHPNAVDTKGTLYIKLTGVGESTDFSAITNNNEHLDLNLTVSHLVVFNTSMPVVTAVEVKYVKDPGFLGLFGVGKNTFEIGGVEVRTGAQMQEFGSCFAEYVLTSSQPLKLVLQQDQYASTVTCNGGTIVG